MFLRTALILFITANMFAAAPEGIPRELARARASMIADVRYQLGFSVTPHTPDVTGHEELKFNLLLDNLKKVPTPEVLLDFREGTVSKLVVNGKASQATIENGHIALAGTLLQGGLNTVSMDFTAPVAPAGKAFTRFEDKDDNSEYIYTLFVPMDASMAFPCFDQPDLKARFKLAVIAPATWTVISNTSPEGTGTLSSVQETRFAETKPISTYLFAFAAGPFKKVHDTPGLPGLYVRQSKLKKAEEEAPEVQEITAQGIKYLSDYFAQPFPFPKYDMVMIPGFAYGGMEHAGATFLREESILFRAAPTHSDHLNRDILLLHELTHQWFGDLVTMRWFDDLWLKEGFAEYMAFHAMADVMPKENFWKRFYQSVKPSAYGIDRTKGTTPIYQDIGNLKDAKSAYGAIVYDKAPGVIKQLAFVVGEDKFRDGLRLYLREHSYGNAEWNDLVKAFEQVSGVELQEWAKVWIRRRGMPQVDVEWSCNKANRIEHFILKQHDVLDEKGVWPMAMEIALHYPNDSVTRVKVELKSQQAEVPQALGYGCPVYVFANDQDYGYGLFLLDLRSRRAVMEELGAVKDLFQRTLLWGSLWSSVREADLDPKEYIDLAIKLLPEEKDETLAGGIASRLAASLHFYVSPEVRAQLVPRAEALAYDEAMHASDLNLRIVWYRALRWVAESDRGRGYIKDILSGKLTVPGVTLRPLDRWTMVTSLIALNDPDAGTIYTEEQKRDQTGDGLKYAYDTAAARPDAKTKQEYFHDYLQNPSRPEDWVEGSLGSFNYWNQSDLTLPYLKSALDALPQVKRERKIFFVLAWLRAFIDGQQSAAAQQVVHEFLQTASLDPDLRLKILEISDGLDRTVKIRSRYK